VVLAATEEQCLEAIVANLSQIKHVIVVMFENRSFDNMLGWLYPDGAPQPSHFLPGTNTAPFEGLKPELWNPSNESYFNGAPPDKVPISFSAPNMTTPDVDPEEQYQYVSEQIYGTEQPNEHPAFPMMGFVVNYQKKVSTSQSTQMMQPFSVEQLPVLSGLAKSYAVSDAWFSSVPSQTWANRSFVHAGTSNGNVDNGLLPNPLDWNVPTIFNVLADMGIAWNVYADTEITPSLTRTMFPKLWPLEFDQNFKSFEDFQSDCKAGSLPAYSFVEPSFVDKPNDQHPPHDVAAGERFLLSLWEAASQSPAWNETLLIITYDEHGGTYDHVLPPWGATCPDAKSDPGREGFTFNRFGVRVPMVVVSPWIQEGSVFRTDSDVPYDHTSILATLRDWLNIPADKMLPSKRISDAPTLSRLLTLPSARTDMPNISGAATGMLAALKERLVEAIEDPAMNDLQASLVSGTAVRLQQNPAIVRNKVRTRNDAMEFFRGHRIGHK
jgi:phospholipase C